MLDSLQMFQKNTSLLLPVILFLVIITSCNKLSDKPFEFEYIDVNTQHTIYHIDYLEGFGFYGCGGDRYEYGFWMQSQTGFSNWKIDSITNKALYKTKFLHSDLGFVIGFDGRIYRTQDNTQSWGLYQWGNYHPFQDIAFATDSLLFLAGGTSYLNGEILRTSTTGNLWETILFEEAIRTIHFINADTGYAAGYGVVYQTNDGGLSWDKTTLSGDLFVDIYFPDETTGFLLGYQGEILKTTNKGVTWNTILSGNKPFSKRRNPESIHFFDANHGMVVGRNGLVLYTSDGGNNWYSISGLPVVNFKTIYMFSIDEAIIAGENGTLIKVNGVF